MSQNGLMNLRIIASFVIYILAFPLKQGMWVFLTFYLFCLDILKILSFTKQQKLCLKLISIFNKENCMGKNLIWSLIHKTYLFLTLSGTVLETKYILCTYKLFLHTLSLKNKASRYFSIKGQI